LQEKLPFGYQNLEVQHILSAPRVSLLMAETHFPVAFSNLQLVIHF
jgi:hypothetical protein